MGVAAHPELFGQGRTGCALRFELLYELSVFFELVFEHVSGGECFEMDVLIASFSKESVAMGLVSSLDLYSFAEDVV